MQMRRLPDRLRDERGFTLIELMISMTIMSVIIVPVIGSFLIGITESTSSRERVADSSTAQLVSAYILGDIQSSKTVAKDVVGGTCPSGSPALLKLTWADPSTSEAFVVSYVEQSDHLTRFTCINGGAADGDELAADLAEFDVTCFASDGSESSDCSSVTKVHVHVKAESPEPSDASSYGPFEFEFDATRRVTS
jgi:prepilin-type N-terminal cleavage/methylation domain-containing protein